MNKINLINEWILFDSKIFQQLICESKYRDHNSQYVGNNYRSFKNIFISQIQKTKIFYSTHFIDEIDKRIYNDDNLTYNELIEFKNLIKIRMQNCVKYIYKEHNFNQITQNEFCYLFWFPKTKDTFIVMFDKDFHDDKFNNLTFTTLLPRMQDNELPKKKMESDIFVTMNEN